MLACVCVVIQRVYLNTHCSSWTTLSVENPEKIFEKKYTDLGRILDATERYISRDYECGIIMNVGVSRPYNIVLNILISLLQWSRRYAYKGMSSSSRLYLFIFFKYITFFVFRFAWD